MGREIRRVPPNWEHPTYLHQYINHPLEEVFHPLHDKVYEDALAEWQEAKRRWDADEPDEDGERRSEIMAKYPAESGRYEDWDGPAPDPDYYRHRRWTSEEATAFQYYETTSEGTPLSPVCLTREAMIDWLVSAEVDVQRRPGPGFSRAGAEAFVKVGSAPTFVGTKQAGIEPGIEHLDREAQKARA